MNKCTKPDQKGASEHSCTRQTRAPGAGTPCSLRSPPRLSTSSALGPLVNDPLDRRLFAFSLPVAFLAPVYAEHALPHHLSPPLSPSSHNAEYLQICRAVAIGFAMMGGIGYLVKLIHVRPRTLADMG